VLALLLSLAVSAPPPVAPPELPKQGPTPSELAKLYFLAGDLDMAANTCRMGLKVEPKKCGPMLKALAEYGYLASKRDTLTQAEVKSFLAWDHILSPGTPSKLTEPVIKRAVTQPLALAHARAQAGDRSGARKFLEAVLEVDPKNAEALGLMKDVQETASDGGRAK
jgi:hypothetical protein